MRFFEVFVQEQGMMSTVGSLGALLLWGIDEGLTQIDKCGKNMQTAANLIKRQVPVELRCQPQGASVVLQYVRYLHFSILFV